MGLIRYEVNDILVLIDLDTGRWGFASGPSFPAASEGQRLPPPPHNGAVFFRTDLGAHYVYDNATWTLVGGGSGAPSDAEYVTAAAHGDLSAERVLTDTATVTWDFGTPGQAKANASAAPAPDTDAQQIAMLALMGF